jgi:DNA-binding MarR family transcriptional regulator
VPFVAANRNGGKRAMARSNKNPDVFVVKLPEIDARTFLLFIQTADAVLKYSEAMLNKAGLSLIKHIVLQLGQSHEGSLTPSEIACLALREKHDISTLIRRLQRDRLVKVERNCNDKRSFNVIITAKGRRAILDAAPAAKDIVKKVMSTIPDSSTIVLEGFLKTLKQNAWDSLAKSSKSR